MDTFTVTDEGDGIIRIEAQTKLMRLPLARAICDDVDRAAARHGSFKILMDMGAISRGTPAAGFHTLRSMKHYDLRGLAFYGANRFMRTMARTVLGLARFSDFAIFEDEGTGRKWLEAMTPGGQPQPRLPRSGVAVGVAAAVAGGSLAVRRAIRRRRLG